MRVRGPLVLAAAIALLALGFGLAAFAVVSEASDARGMRADLVTAERRLASVEAAALMDRETRRVFDEMSRLGTDVSEAWIAATEGSTAGRGRAKAAAAWERVKALLGGPAAPAGVRVSVYEETPEGSPEPVRLLGFAEGGQVTTDGLDAWTGRIPAGLIASEAQKAETADVSDLLWFSAEATGTAGAAKAIRVHQHALYSHTYESRDGSESVIRGVEVSMPFSAPPTLTVEVRCDVVDAGVVRALPAHAVPGGRTAASDDVVAPALLPKSQPWRHPVEDAAARATARAAAPLVGWASAGEWRLLLVACGALLVAAGVVLGASLRGRAGRAAPDVTAEVAHELKTPLTAMRGSLEVALRRERAPDEYRETLASTLEEVKGLQNLVGSVLLLTRGAETPPEKEPVDVVELVRAEAERVHNANPDRAVSHASVKGPRIVEGDPSLLARAVANLLDNAVLHSVAGGAIRVRVEAVGGEAGQLVVSVEDDGPGIPASRREKVFERFYRGPDVGRRGIPGAGLGLPIARWIAELHRGSLVLDPAVEDRARFVLRLPVASA